MLVSIGASAFQGPKDVLPADTASRVLLSKFIDSETSNIQDLPNLVVTGLS